MAEAKVGGGARQAPATATVRTRKSKPKPPTRMAILATMNLALPRMHGTRATIHVRLTASSVLVVAGINMLGTLSLRLRKPPRNGTTRRGSKLKTDRTRDHVQATIQSPGRHPADLILQNWLPRTLLANAPWKWFTGAPRSRLPTKTRLHNQARSNRTPSSANF